MSSSSRHDAPSPLELLDAEDATLLDAYLCGRCTSQQYAAIARWSAGAPGRRALLDGLRRGVTQTVMPPPLRDHAARYTAILAATAAHGRDRGPANPRRPVRANALGRIHRALALGVGMTAACIAGLLVLHTQRKPSTQLSAKHVVTGVGERATVTLDDGTRVVLAPRTTLTIPAAFGQTTRAVTIIGAAQFTVSTDARVPFLVHTGRVTARVLGTTFTVRRYAGESVAQVAVASGKVSVAARHGHGTPITLVAGGLAEATDSGVVRVSEVGGDEANAWVSGRLVFRRARARDVLDALSRWYGVTFQLSDSTLLDHKLNVGIDTESATAALRTLGLALDVDVVRNADTITLRTRFRRRDIDRPARTPSFIPSSEVGR